MDKPATPEQMATYLFSEFPNLVEERDCEVCDTHGPAVQVTLNTGGKPWLCKSDVMYAIDNGELA